MPSGAGPKPQQQAAQLSELFLKLSMAIDQFRDTATGLTTEQVLNLGTVARHLDEISGQLNAAAIAEILRRVQPSVDKIVKATKDAQKAVKTVKKIQSVVANATASLALAAAIVAGNPGTIESAVGGLVTAVAAAVKGGDSGKKGAAGDKGDKTK